MGRGNIGFEELLIREDYRKIYCGFNMRFYFGNSGILPGKWIVWL